MYFPVYAYLAVFVLHVCFLSAFVFNKISFDNLILVSIFQYNSWFIFNCNSVNNQLVYSEPNSFTYSVYEMVLPNLLSCKNNSLTAFQEIGSSKLVCIPNILNSKMFNRKLFKNYNVYLDAQLSLDEVIKMVLPVLQTAK